MKLSWNWLSELVDLSGLDAKHVADAFTMSGTKVEYFEELGADIKNVVVGHVLSVEKHPDADRLFACKIDAGGEAPLQIITGADNVVPGAYVPAALDGSLLPGGKAIKSGKMRGLTSEGMLCSGAELGLDAHDEPGADADGILLLTEGDFKPGQDITEALELRDIVFDFEITNNRPDCLSVIGLAREAAAALGREMKPSVWEKVSGSGDIAPFLKVSVEDPSLCPRYTARMARNIKIKPSPRRMRRFLRSCGVRPINNIVDITNFVMLEYGQPMHAFDHACVNEGALIIRAAREGETLETLDGQLRRLEPGMLVIADPHGPTAVAGVMGGAASEITEKTTDIVFESANFSGPSVRKTALALNMRTDASSRFEKGLDMTVTVTAAERACNLVEALGAGEVVAGIADVTVSAPHERVIDFDPDRINAHLGSDIPEAKMRDILISLGFTLDGNAVTVPSWRADVLIWQDLSEEVARLYGYNNLPSTLTISRNQGWKTPVQLFRDRVRELCLAFGYSEQLTYSFIGPSDYGRIRLPEESPLRDCFTIINPLGEETGVMRPLALPSLMASLERNAAAREPEAWLFEIATVYLKCGKQLPDEVPHLIIGGYGAGLDFFALKGAVEALFAALKIKGISFSTESVNPSYHPGRCARVSVTGEDIGIIGEIHPLVVEEYGLREKASACEIDLARLFARLPESIRFEALPRFPAMTRDLSLVCPDEVSNAQLENALRTAGGELLRSIALFDVYRGEGLPEGSKSLAYNLTFRADRTLRDEEADEAVSRMLNEVKKLGAVIRS